MSAEGQEQTKQISNGSLSSVLSLLAPADRDLNFEVQHVPPTLEQNNAGVADSRTNISRNMGFQANRDASSPQTSRDIGFPQTNKDVGARTKIVTDAGSGSI